MLINLTQITNIFVGNYRTTALASIVRAWRSSAWAVGLVITTCCAPFAAQAGGGLVTISGRVTDSATGLGIADVGIDTSRNNGVPLPFAVTDANGFYVGIINIDTFAHRFTTAWSDKSMYFPEAYPETICYRFCHGDEGAIFRLSAGQNLTNINFTLERGGRVLANVVAESDAAPLSGVRVSLASSSLSGSLDAGLTNTSGVAVSLLFPAGSYKAYVAPTNNYIGEVYNNRPCLGACEPAAGDDVVVVAGATTALGFSLPKGVSISGHLRDTGGNPIAGSVAVYNQQGAVMVGGGSGTDGVYRTGALPPGAYVVLAMGGTGIPAVNPGIACPHCDPYLTGTPVSVGTIPVNDVDIVLQTGATISGAILFSDANWSAVYGDVSLWTLAGDRVRVARTGTTAYTLGGLEAGDYRLVARAMFPSVWSSDLMLSSRYVGEVYLGIPCYFDRCSPEFATVVHVGAGATLTGIDVHLTADPVFRSGIEGGVNVP